MSRTSPAHRATRILVLALALFTTSASGCARRAPTLESPPTAPARLHLLVVNGGGKPVINFQSHLLHVRQLLHIADSMGIPPERITVFSSDGDDPADDLAVRSARDDEILWPIFGTPLYQALRRTRYTNSTLDGVSLRPATKAALGAWFADDAARLGEGDTLLLYVTDHGERNPHDSGDNTITLWGEGESLSVTELNALLAKLDPHVRVVALMSQCFSGAFAGIVRRQLNDDGMPDGSACGFFSSTQQRPAYGCYAENRGRDNVGHSFHFFQGMVRRGSLAAAHEYALVEDGTPDVPNRTSDRFLRARLAAEAKRRGVRFREFVDGLLAEAWRDRGRFEPQIRLLDRIGHAFGFFSPRTLAELREQKQRLPEISAHLKRVATAWKSALADANRARLGRFLEEHPQWRKRLAADELKQLDAEAVNALALELLAALSADAARDGDNAQRLQTLHERETEAAAASYRMEVRLAAVLRMRAILVEVAGRVWLQDGATAAEQRAYADLVACEESVRIPEGIEIADLSPHEPFPPFDTDITRANAAMPAWMGVRFRAVEDDVRRDRKLAAGAARVLTVYPDSPAAAAGIRVGDILVGPPEQPFTEMREVRSWTMLSEIGVERRLSVLRDDGPLEVGLVPGTYPLEWPSLPGPPEVGSAAPPLQLTPYRGDLSTLAGHPHLLFFWATWCPPCKAAVPQLIELEKSTGLPVVAITDESREDLDRFFAKVGSFPRLVAIDRFRQTHLAYGISGTPTFVLIGADRTVLHVGSGYDASKGLGLPEPFRGTPAP